MTTLTPIVQWTSAFPLWRSVAETPIWMQRPVLLRFASDRFMEELASILQTKPNDLEAFVARPESFRERPAGAPPDWQGRPNSLKLYQPAHGHFYLVAASLVCRKLGLPDKVVNTAQQEKVSFVLRRVEGEGQESAWVNNPRTGKNWLPLEPGRQRMLVPSEELLPVFPITFPAEGRMRRVFVGLVPTSSRETFHAAGRLSPFAPSIDPRMEEFKARVVEPLNELNAQRIPDGASNVERQLLAQKQIEASLFLLLDLGEFLSRNLSSVWNSLYQGNPLAPGSPARSLYLLLDSRSADGIASWRSALRQAWDQWAEISGESGEPTKLAFNLRHSTLSGQELEAEVRKVVAAANLPLPPAASLPEVPKLDPSGALYCLRCVYQRPQCGPLRPDVISEPSEPFVLAAFFDPDAPARPIRIGLPVDTSLAGLRKFPKNVSFLMSEKLREQMSRATDLKKSLDGKLGSSESFEMGEICSFSIPVITICALVVMMVFVLLLNFVFWWLPLLRICLPINLKAKG
jgi:hypothetical protein